MDRLSAIRSQLVDAWIPELYLKKVRSQRTRSVQIVVPARLNAAEIQYTLLGIELKVGRRRHSCPDLATARYMRVFARIGVADFAMPYDITKISVVADELETAWQKLLLVAKASGKELSEQGKKRALNQLMKTLREEIAEIGPGEAMPTFDRETRRRGN